jgi:acetyl-CoA/propionyl-CoA carboxylase carboxyl transferase subunit
MTALATPDLEIDPRDSELRLSRLFHPGSIEPIHDRDKSGVFAARAALAAVPAGHGAHGNIPL